MGQSQYPRDTNCAAFNRAYTPVVSTGGSPCISFAIQIDGQLSNEPNQAAALAVQINSFLLAVVGEPNRSDPVCEMDLEGSSPSSRRDPDNPTWRKTKEPRLLADGRAEGVLGQAT